MGTWLSRTPELVKPGDVVIQFPQLKIPDQQSVKTVAILVTPSFAHWLEDGHPFLENAAKRIWGRFMGGESGNKDAKYRSMSAIVDRLPVPLTTMTDRAETELVVDEDSCEGIAMYLHATCVENVDEGDTDKEDHDVATIRFILGHPDNRISNSGTSLRLPPANTLFVNGYKSTMLLDHWRIHNADGLISVRHEFRRRLKSFDLYMPISPSAFPEIYSPLSSLTAPRKIASSMGNVIRELEGYDNGKPTPASSELEQVVPQFLDGKAKTSSPEGSMQIYALVTPPSTTTAPASKHAELSSAGNQNSKVPGFDVGKAIANGARLHRVTSGGGGWGKKQGLLSIEPAVDFSTRATRQMAPFLDDDHDDRAKEQAELFAPGHDIQFFASYHAPRPEATSKMPDLPRGTDVAQWCGNKEWKQIGQSKIRLGIIPPFEKFANSTNIDSEALPELVCYPGYFGMLTESGTCLEHLQPLQGASDPGIGHFVSTFQTRVDVPYTVFGTTISNPLPDPQ